MTATAKHPTRVQQAQEEGYHDGEKYAELSQQLCSPGERTEERKSEWIDMLTWLGTCPYAVDQQPYTDATDTQNAFYASQWAIAFRQGKNKTEAELRRASTVT